ncbi:hypothetical protein ACWCSD_50820 [Nonomuraea sp. NPDC001684]
MFAEPGVLRAYLGQEPAA